jgi:hypothetical protein
MDRIETIQVRPFRPSNREEAIAAFGRLSLPEPSEGLRRVLLLQDTILDLCIVLNWRSDVLTVEKSPLGIQLASAFAEFGRIDHTVWSNAQTIYHSYANPGTPETHPPFARGGEIK